MHRNGPLLADLQWTFLLLEAQVKQRHLRYYLEYCYALHVVMYLTWKDRSIREQN